MWVKLIDASQLSAELLAEMKKDGLTFRGTNQGAHIIAVTTDNPWLARKWDMSALAEQEGLKLTACEICPKESFLGRFAKIGALNLIFLLILAVLVAAWLIRL